MRSTHLKAGHRVSVYKYITLIFNYLLTISSLLYYRKSGDFSITHRRRNAHQMHPNHYDKDVLLQPLAWFKKTHSVKCKWKQRKNIHLKHANKELKVSGRKSSLLFLRVKKVPDFAFSIFLSWRVVRLEYWKIDALYYVRFRSRKLRL